jgi:aspartyl-tRNA(Asn)/glutamyl-tRNA(Gln) amidotransferase subunit B
VEIKNLNSFKSVEAAIEFEIARQISVIESGQNIEQETRGWDELNGKTFVQRSKETAKDYRYFPDPDLPKLDIEKFVASFETRSNDIFESLPSNKRLKYKDIGLTSNMIEVILQSRILSDYFNAIVKLYSDHDLKILCNAANYLVTDLAPFLSVATSNDVILSPAHFYELMTLLYKKQVTSRVAKDIIIALALADTDPYDYALKQGLLGENSMVSIESLIADVITQNQSVVADYRSGKTAALQFLLGQTMKRSRGSIDPGILSDALKQAIG